MPAAVLGTAHLFGLTSEGTSNDVLDAAWPAGFHAFDTAPLYGHGRSEAELGRRRSGWSERSQVTSKVGLEPLPPASRGVRAVKAAARSLPGPVQRRLRAGGDGVPHGVFDPESVRRSVDRTLLRLGPVDRMMLHEARAEDLTDELLSVLSAFRTRGDVGQWGVASVNAAAGAVARRAPELLTAAHIEVGPFAPATDLPGSVITVVGHGVLGPGGSALRRLSQRLRADVEGGAAWLAATTGTRWSGHAGLADALVARAAARPLSDIIVATSRPERLANLRALVSGTEQLPGDVAAALDALVRAERRHGQPSPA